MTDNAAALTPDISAALAAPELRIEGPLKVTGRARYASDAHKPGMLHAGFVRSPHPHARIVAIDTSAARPIDGVHAVLTAEDIGHRRFGRTINDWPVLCWDKVHFIGDRVAIVAAETPEALERALQAVRVDYEGLTPVLDPLAALADNAPIIHEDYASYLTTGSGWPNRPHPNLHGMSVITKGDEDIELALARADRVFEHTFHTPRQHQGYLEPHVSILWIEDQSVRIITSSKAPFRLRNQMSVVTGLPVEQIDVDSCYVGGDFGGKGLSMDDFALYYVAQATGRPVKAVMSYSDELQASAGRHGAVIRLRTGVMNDGRIVAHDAEVIFDGGAFAAGKQAEDGVLASGAKTMAPYSIPNTRITLKTAYTNTVAGGHMRVPGEFQSVFAGESHVDLIASELGIDPLEFRLINAVRVGETGPTNEVARSPKALEILETLRRELRWGENDSQPNRGRGVALGYGHTGEGKTSVVFALKPDGIIEVLTGVPDQGSGGHTVIRRVSAATLSIKPERVVIRHGTTAEAPLDPGAGASRVTHIVGQASLLGSVELKSRLEELATEVMGWPAGHVHIKDDHFVVDDENGQSVPFAEVTDCILASGDVKVTGAYGSAHAHTDPSDYSFYGYGVEVEVDPETGAVSVIDALLVADVGTIINPTAHQGQLDGGFIYGLGNAMMEDLAMQDGRVTAANLGEYKLPTSEDVPRFRAVLLEAPAGPGPFGSKMAGELASTGVAPAMANAIAAACGARLSQLPLTSERVYEAINR
ncbi:MAG: xanthine dehydrogenase family protein molybdopterin-binding subunit [Chloroflexota bacterium]